MPKKKITNIEEAASVNEPVVNMGPVNVAPNPKDEVVQKIANLCTSIGDRSFVIRQAESDITSYYVQIDQLREQLRALETTNGPEANPAK